MRKLVPRSLFGQTLATLMLGLILSIVTGFWIYRSDREEAVRSVGGLATVDRIVNLARLLQDSPKDWRTRIVEASSDEAFMVTLATEPLREPASDSDVATAETLKQFLISRLSLKANDEPVVYVSGYRCEGCEQEGDDEHHPSEQASTHESKNSGGHEAHERPAAFTQIQVSLRMQDNLWLNVTNGLPDGGQAFSSRFFASMAIMAVVLMGVSVWVVGRVTAPLAEFAKAARRLGSDLNSEPMPENGTVETRQAAQAFNSMQERLRAMIDDRTRTLAAISHDFRTPLTLLRLRAENVEDAAEREKMLSTIADLDAMVAATLEFASGENRKISPRRTNLTALVTSIVDDLSDGGLPVTMAPVGPVLCLCDPISLKRAVTNLIENALKYGMRARVSVSENASDVTVTIDDDGPGIPEDKLSHVLEPLYRLEDSRSRETGGMGLGLAIVESIVRAHGGKLVLANRAEGGLRATITLPRP